MPPEPGSLVLNPHLQVRLERETGSTNALTVWAPVKGESLKVTRIERSVEPQLFGTLVVHLATGTLTAAALTAEERARLAGIGVLVPEDRISTPVSFACDIDDPPLDLVPSRARRSVADLDAPDLIAAATLRHLGTDGPTREMRGRLELPNRFRKDRSWIVIEDPQTGTPAFYSCGHDAAGAVDTLRPGEPAPPGLPPGIRQQLLEANVIHSRAAAAAAAELRDLARASARTALRESRYAVLPQVIAPLQVAAIRRYYRSLIREGLLPFDETEWHDRFYSFRDSITYFYQQQLTDLVATIAGERVKPSFSCFTSYYPGSVLPPHRDRAQCEYGISVLVDHSPEPKDVSPWPLYVQPPGSTAATPISIGLGDAIVYRGREVSHFRERLADADYCSYWFVFYVPETFDGPLD